MKTYSVSFKNRPNVSIEADEMDIKNQDFLAFRQRGEAVAVINKSDVVYVTIKPEKEQATVKEEVVTETR